jgi:hypothetical protein
MIGGMIPVAVAVDGDRIRQRDAGKRLPSRA